MAFVKLLKFFSGAGLLCALTIASAEDIDIFSAPPLAGGAPNVLIVMDNSANWSESFSGSTKFSAERDALSSVVNSLTQSFNLGLMAFTETGSGNSGPDGGYVRFAVQPMTGSVGAPTAARQCLLGMIQAGQSGCPTYQGLSLLDINSDKSNGGKAGLTMAEAYYYFKGDAAYAGNNKAKADALAFDSDGTYKSPITDACQKNFIIFISNGPFSDNQADTSEAMSRLQSAGGNTSVINPPDTSNNNNAADEWVRYLRQSSLGVVTYTLEVGPSTTGQGPYNTALLKSMGTQGQGGYYAANDAAQLNAALGRIVSDILATNSVFASSSLPLSANNSGAFLNQVYVGMFRPDPQTGPRWLGNLKQYQFAIDSNNNLTTVDALGNLAASASTGFAQTSAQSFWTSKDTALAPDAIAQTSTSSANGSTGGFWYFDSKGDGGPYDLPDGEWVEKGGAAQQLRLAHLGYGGKPVIGDNNDVAGARQVLTCIACSPNLTSPPLLQDFEIDNTNLTATRFGLPSGSQDLTLTSETWMSPNPTLTVGKAPKVISLYAEAAGGANKVATVTVGSGHGFQVGDQVVVSDNSLPLTVTAGPFPVTAVTGTGVSFRCGTSCPGAPAVSKYLSAQGVVVTIAATAHGFAVGDTVTVDGTVGGTASVPGPVFTRVVNIETQQTNSFTYTETTLRNYTTGVVRVFRHRATATPLPVGVEVGSIVNIGSASPGGYDSSAAIVKAVGSDSFSYNYGGSNLVPLASGTATYAATGQSPAGLIRWVRGQDVLDENNFMVGGQNTDVRASIHGDVLHSRPLIINYGTVASPDSYVFYGGNDGLFRAVKGGQAATDGKEQWAFVAEEFLTKLRRQYTNLPKVLYPNSGSGVTPAPRGRDYFWDGPVSSHVERDAAGVVTKAWLFIAVRRGGRFIYALDVTQPSLPKFLWKKSSADFPEMGQTWSAPKVARVRAKGADPVLIFGAGYDPAEDAETPPVSNSMGRAVFILNARDGSLVWKASYGATNSNDATGQTRTDMTFGFAADVTLMDRNDDGYFDRAYAADLGGRIWRLDIDDASVTNWRVWKVATLGDRTALASSRKFLFPVDAVIGSVYDSIIGTSGDREHPLAASQANSVINRLYVIRDNRVGVVGADQGIVDICRADTTVGGCTNLVNATLNEGGTTAFGYDGAAATDPEGWMSTLRAGEKGVNAPVVVGGSIIFGTNQPDTSTAQCSAGLGIARRYSVSLIDGSATRYTRNEPNPTTPGQTITVLSLYSEISGGGFPPSPVTGVVEIGSQKVVFVTDNPLSPGGVFSPPVSVSQSRFRTYWRQRID